MDLQKVLGLVSSILLILAGLNLGLVELFQFDLVGMVVGAIPSGGAAFNVLAGLSAVYAVVTQYVMK